MLNIEKEDLLKSTPEYEDYSENEAKLSIKELRDYGLLKCGGCCSKKDGNSSCGCSKK